MNTAAETQLEAVSNLHQLQQMLTFALGSENYGVDIQRVQEIRGWSAVTPIPESPAHILGVLNLRGMIVPIIDLRIRLGMPDVGNGATTVIIVLSVVTTQGARLFGIVVDRVSDVANISEAQLQPIPAVGNHSSARYLRGLAQLHDLMVLLLDIDALLSDSDSMF
ncbi:MAG: chemotaxis protein CheW [Steroidobacteraceae bacterium]